MMSYLLCLVILPCCIGHTGSALDNHLHDYAGTALSLLQVQAHPAVVEKNASSVGHSHKLHAMGDRALPRLMPAQTSVFRELEQQGARLGLDDGIAVIVPGFGDERRAQVVKRNIAWLKTQDINFDCTIYVYRSEKELPLSAKEYAPCKLIRHDGYWMDHLRAFPLHQTRHRWVLHMVDSIEVFADVRLKRMIDIMKTNGLRHAAPTFPIYGKYPIMSKDLTPDAVGPGRLVKFIEFQLDLFSRDYFACLQDMIDADNGMGWGMDRVLPSVCKGKKGLIDEMTMQKMFTGSYNWTDAEENMTGYLDKLATEFPKMKVVDPLDRNLTLSQLKEPLDAVTDRVIPNLVPPNTSTFRMLEQKGAQDGLEDGIAVIITGQAGFGNYDRCELVKSNIAWIQSQGIPFECTIYTYYSRINFVLIDKNYAPCKIVRVPGYRMDHLRAFPLHKTRRRWVLHMSVSIEPDANVNLGRMIDIMTANGLSHAAPTLPTSGRYPIMASHGNSTGRLVSFIEMQMDMFSREYFACLQDIISDDNGMGWGLEMVLPSLCGGRRGLIDEMTVDRRFGELVRQVDFERNVGIISGQFATKFPGLPLADTNITYSPLLEPMKSGASQPHFTRFSSNGHSEVGRLLASGLTLTRVIPNFVPQNITTYRALEKRGASRGLKDGIFLILPGIADLKQARSAKKNIAWILRQGVKFECAIFVNSSIKGFRKQDYAPCNVIKHSGYWLHDVCALSLQHTSRRWVLHMRAGIEPQADVKLGRMIDIIKANGLSHAAPTFPTYERYPIMASDSRMLGRTVSFIELQMDLFSREYFACLQDIVSEDNGRGWGIDMLLPSLCGGKRGLIDEMTMVRKSAESYRSIEAERNMGILLGELAIKFPGLQLADRNTTYSELESPREDESSEG